MTSCSRMSAITALRLSMLLWISLISARFTSTNFQRPGAGSMHAGPEDNETKTPTLKRSTVHLLLQNVGGKSRGLLPAAVRGYKLSGARLLWSRRMEDNIRFAVGPSYSPPGSGVW